MPSETSATPTAETRLKGLVRRGTGWSLTRRGWFMLLLLTLGLIALCLRGIHPFLAVTKPVEADVLIVEGWDADYALRAAVQEFEVGEYDTVYVTGGPIQRGAPLSEYGTYAALGAAVMVHFGAPAHQVHAVPASKAQRDRTYASALALRDWLEEEGSTPQRMNLVTVGAHARRSRLLFNFAFAESAKIGVIAVDDEEYEPHRWWAYSKGVRTVISETAAYLYARGWFRASADWRPEKKSGEAPVGTSP